MFCFFLPKFWTLKISLLPWKAAKNGQMSGSQREKGGPTYWNKNIPRDTQENLRKQKGTKNVKRLWLNNFQKLSVVRKMTKNTFQVQKGTF